MARPSSRRSRRSAGAAAVTTIYWRDIPAQVTASAGGDTHKALLAPRFQHAIDRAATVAGLTETDAYVAQWRRAASPLDGADPADAVDAAARSIDDEYPRQRLEALVAAGGVEPGHDDAGPVGTTSRADEEDTP